MKDKILKSSVWSTLKEYALITFGVGAYALGWSIFLLPNNLIGGGVSGFASIVFYATGLPMGVTYLILNILLILIGTKILGTGFGGKTIYAIIMTAVLLAVLPKVIPMDFIHEFALSNCLSLRVAAQEEQISWPWYGAGFIQPLQDESFSWWTCLSSRHRCCSRRILRQVNFCHLLTSWLSWYMVSFR